MPSFTGLTRIWLKLWMAFSILGKKNGDGWDMILPESLKGEAVRLNHDLPSSGQQGRDRTRGPIKEKFFWYGLTQDVNNYVAT